MGEGMNLHLTFPAVKNHLKPVLSKPVFLPAADLNRLRRGLVDCLEKNRLTAYARLTAGPRPTPVPFYRTNLDFRANAANRLSVQFYKKRGLKSIDPAFESGQTH
jgi:putative protease